MENELGHVERARGNHENLIGQLGSCDNREGKFECRFCKKILSSKQNLKEHEFTHTGELPYICKNPGCGMRFRQGSVLSAHKRIHVVVEKIVNQEKCRWVKVIFNQLTDLLKLTKEAYVHDESEAYERVDIPPISKPQPFIIHRKNILY